MTDRNFRLLFGLLLLGALYLELHAMVLALITVLFLEGVTGRRLAWLIVQPHTAGRAPPDRECRGVISSIGPQIPFDAERAWRIAVAVMLVLTFQAFPAEFWFFPWFMGFAILGAGVSGVCPVLMLFQLCGFR